MKKFFNSYKASFDEHKNRYFFNIYFILKLNNVQFFYFLCYRKIKIYVCLVNNYYKVLTYVYLFILLYECVDFS